MKIETEHTIEIKGQTIKLTDAELKELYTALQEKFNKLINSQEWQDANRKIDAVKKQIEKLPKQPVPYFHPLEPYPYQPQDYPWNQPNYDDPSIRPPKNPKIISITKMLGNPDYRGTGAYFGLGRFVPDSTTISNT